MRFTLKILPRLTIAWEQWRGGILYEKTHGYFANLKLEFAFIELKNHIHASVVVAWHQSRLGLTE